MIKKFITKTAFITLLFAFVYVIMVEGIFCFFPNNTHFIFDQNWLKIKQRVESSKSKIDRDTLYVGCSVAGQLLPFNGSNQLTTNGSTYTVGNYFLIKNAIQRNKNIKTVIYLSIPNVIGHKLARKKTYNNFVKPFYTFENRKEIMEDKNTRLTLNKNPILLYVI